ALDVVLRDGGESADGHGEDGDGGHEHHPVDADGPENCEEQAKKERKTCGLRRDADVGGDRGGRAFVDVGSPLMKWDGGDFEEHAGSNRGDGEEDEDIAAGKHLVTLGEADGNHVEV